MPSSEAVDDEAALTRPTKATTPRRSPAVRRTANATPKRKVSANKAGTPNSAPARTKPGTKKAEPTLLGDFFLGRPSVNRARRKSLDVVPIEMKKSAVGKVQPPGGVKERVKQWQKASAAAVVEDTIEPPSEPDDISLDLDDDSVTERDRRRIKFRKNQTHRPGRRKSDDMDHQSTPVKSVSSPKKRVVSDDHWMMNKEKKSPPRTPSLVDELFSKGKTIPKDFLKSSANPPLEKKIEDWKKRTVSKEAGCSNKRARKVSKNVFANEEARIIPSKSESSDRGVQAIPSHGKPSIDTIEAKPVHNEGRRKGRQYEAEDYDTPSRRGEKHKELSPDMKGSLKSRIPHTDIVVNEEKSDSPCRTPTHPPRSKNRQRNSVSPESLADIPVGYSAFSVLNISVGGDATTMKLSRPQRQPSLSAVPKVLKKVYAGGMKIVHDTVDPPRIGVSQPPSIESWLKGTSDPFVDHAPMPKSVLGMAKPKARRRSYEKEGSCRRQDPHENESHDILISERPIRGVPTSQHCGDDAASTRQAGEPSVNARAQSERKASKNISQPFLPTGLNRSSATRNTASPKPASHTPPRDVKVNPYDGEPQSVQGRSPSLSASDPVSSNEMMKGTNDASWGLKDRAADREVNGDREGYPSTRSPRTLDTSCLNSKDLSDPKSYESSGHRDCPASGQHRLSTIASVETFKTSSSSSSTETSSQLSETTVTQTTVTQNTSRTSNTSNASYTSDKVFSQRSNDLGSKRRLTKHSDLLSVLSLPDTSVPGRTKSIKSARSIRTTRSRLATATIPDLLRELADDEVKYMRELRTLVDGVIPVLLTCVLSKSDSAVAAGMFGQNSSGHTDAFITKPIVDMGVALEQLKSFHKHIPLHNLDLLVHWALGAHKVYEDYVDAWRMGFQNVIVNLAPASLSDSAKDQLLDEMPRNRDGDVLNENGERVDVAFLLKRPLVRVKYLAKIMTGVYTIKPQEQAAKVNDKYQDLLAKIRRRTREEEARLEDQAACSTDATRARDLRTLDPIEGVTIDATRQVCAKDFFDFSLPHSCGQRIDCRVELLFRDKPHDKSDVGDVLICEVDTISRWLLFPPIELDRISARTGDAKGELVVMIRGIRGSKSWQELFTLASADEETAAEWIQMLGLSPIPLHLQYTKAPSVPVLSIKELVETTEDLTNGLNPAPTPCSSRADVPIGERRRKDEHLVQSKSRNGWQTASTPKSSHPSAEYSGRVQGGAMTFSKFEPKDLNDAMECAGKLASSSFKRYHSRDQSQLPLTPSSENFAKDSDVHVQNDTKRPPSRGHSSNTSHPQNFNVRNHELYPSKLPPVDTPLIPKHRKILQTSTNEDKSLPLKESMRPDDSFKAEHARSPTKQIPPKHDEAPTPPPHKTSSSALLKKSPVLVKPTSTIKTRRSSSPLKHEYQPSDNSNISSGSDESDAGELEDSSDSSEEELEAVDITTPLPDPRRLRNKVSPAGSFYSLPSASLGPSNSASQGPFQGLPPQLHKTTKLVATLSCWSMKGRWVDLHPQGCSVVVGPGLIEAFVMSAYESSGIACYDDLLASGSSDANTDDDAGVTRPLVSLELTPIVPLRQSNALDIEIRSPPTAKSSVECTHTVRFRSRTLQECSALYAAIHKARMENPVYMKLEQERIVNAYGKQLLEETVGGNRRRSWFSRNKSYRASARAPSDTVSDNSTNSFASAISRLKSMGVIGAFNIDKSSVDMSQGGPLGTSSGETSVYTGSTNSATSGITPPRTPSSPSAAMTGTSNVVSFGSSDLKIRLYLNLTPSKWRDFGTAFLTVTHPPRGMRQASSLYHGVEKRIIVVKKQSKKRTISEKFQGSGSPENEKSGAVQVMLDVVLGGGCFSRQGVVGVVMNVWEDIVGDNGEVGRVAAVGGVSGRTRKWMFHFASGAETAWVFSLVGGGVR